MTDKEPIKRTKRVTKKTDERRAEIVETARRLFIEKGFHETKVSEIVRAIGVSQGVFYYYFPSKDAIINELIELYMRSLEEGGRAILEQSDLNSLQKMERLVDLQLDVNMREVARLHHIKGVDIHERLLQGLVTRFAPLMSEALEPVAKTDNHHIIVEIYLTAGLLLLDPGLFPLSTEQRNLRIDTLIGQMEASLGVASGALQFFRRVMRYGA